MKYKLFFRNQWVQDEENINFNVLSLNYWFWKWDGETVISFWLLGFGVEFEFSTKESRKEARKLQKEAEKRWDKVLEIKNEKKKK